MNSIPTPQEQAQRILDFAQKISNKLDVASAPWNQKGWTLSINPLIEHCTLVECEKNENPFELLDENKVTHKDVRGRVIKQVGEDLVKEAQKIASIFAPLRGYRWEQSEVGQALSIDDFVAAMTPIERADNLHTASSYSCIEALHDIVTYLTQDNRFDSEMDRTRAQYRKDCRKTFKRTRHFVKVGDASTTIYIMKGDSVDSIFSHGPVLGGEFDTAAGTKVQVTDVRIRQGSDKEYQTEVVFADGESLELGWTSTFIDAVQLLLPRLEFHYDLVVRQAEENAKKGMPVTSGWGSGSDEHKYRILEAFEFEIPEPLKYVVLSRQSDGGYYDKYRVEPAGNEVDDKYTPVCEPTTYELAQELCVAMTADFDAGRAIERADEEVRCLNRKMLELRARLSDLRLDRFDKKSDLEAVQLRIQLAQ